MAGGWQRWRNGQPQCQNRCCHRWLHRWCAWRYVGCLASPARLAVGAPAFVVPLMIARHPAPALSCVQRAWLRLGRSWAQLARPLHLIPEPATWSSHCGFRLQTPRLRPRSAHAARTQQRGELRALRLAPKEAAVRVAARSMHACCCVVWWW